jgi:3-oxosteroid 1-dehydrogenase
MNDKKALSRRQLLVGAGKTVAVAIGAGAVALPVEALSSTSKAHWDHEIDVLCIGSGAAACAAAVSAIDRGASAMLIEKMPILGGTTGKSGGVAWIPNHVFLREQGIDDKKEDCMRYMARYAYPQTYTPDSATLGLSERNYRLLAAFYDHGWRMVDRMQQIGAVKFQQFNMWHANRPAPDYADHLPENKVPKGRCIEPGEGAGASVGGSGLVIQMEHWLRARKAPILTGHRVTKILKNGERVIGVEARSGKQLVRIKARRGVVFGTGGFAHNTELVDMHQTALLGACAMPGSTGDFIAIAEQAGARMGPLHTAWRTQVVLEEALENRALGLAAFVLPGDSMIVVNKYGQRVVNEKRNYNDRTQVHFTYDPVREEYPNQLLFMIFDQRTLDAYGGNFPLPLDKRESRFLIQATTLEALGAGIDARLKSLSEKTGGVALSAQFSSTLQESIERYNGYAKAGVDPEFARGLHDYDRDWHLLFSAVRAGTTQAPNMLPNPTMHPFVEQGPYYAFILGAGALDTNGGPLIDEKAQVLGADNKAIAGLYGAGNCIASPARGAYFGAGGTIGLALTFGYIAGMNAALNPVAT